MGSREGSSAEPEQSEEPVDNVMNFDCSLPAMHSYLGENLEELSGRTVLDDWSYYTLPLLPVRGVVLVPGQTLPLNEGYQPTVKMLLSCIQSDHLFGSVGLIKKPNNTMAHLADVGTIAEICECLSQDNGDSLTVKAVGRQRFRIVHAKREPQGFITAKVQILPEIVLPDPMAEIRLGTLNRFRCDSPRQRSLWRRDAMTATWPSWVYSQYRMSSLSDRVKELLLAFNGPNTKAPKDPVALSFWIMRAIPLDDEQRVAMLRLNSAVMRLQYVLKIHKKSAILCCSGCESPVANSTDIFTMSVEGALGAYVNPNGFIHEVITVHKAKNLELRGGAPTAEFSWFPGYAWRIAQCELCLEHIGWRFTAVNPALKPSSFWALAHRSVECRNVQNEAQNEAQNEDDV